MLSYFHLPAQLLGWYMHIPQATSFACLRPCTVLCSVWNFHWHISYVRLLGGGSDVVVVAFLSHARIWGECSTTDSPPMLFFFLLVVFFLSIYGDRSCALIPLFKPGSVHSGSVSRDNCGRVFLDELHVSSFHDSSHTIPGQRHSQPTPTSLGQGCMCI